MHVVRTGREMFWLWLFIIGPVIAPAFYFFAVLAAGDDGRPHRARRRQSGTQALDPERDYRNACARSKIRQRLAIA
jgi:hypothetical protein